MVSPLCIFPLLESCSAKPVKFTVLRLQREIENLEFVLVEILRVLSSLVSYAAKRKSNCSQKLCLGVHKTSALLCRVLVPIMELVLTLFASYLVLIHPGA